jgi:hypothetical protein
MARPNRPALPGLSAKAETPSAAPSAAADRAATEALGAPASSPINAFEKRRAADSAADSAAPQRAAAPQGNDAALARAWAGANAAAGALQTAARQDPAERLDALLKAAPTGLRWRSADGEHAHGQAQQAWWAALFAATAGHWQPAAEVRAEPPAASWLTLRAGDRELAWLSIDGDMLLLTQGGATWRTPISQAQRRQWQETVARWP